MKLTFHLLGLSLAASLAVAPASAQHSVSFERTFVSNTCEWEYDLVLLPSGFELPAGHGLIEIPHAKVTGLRDWFLPTPYLPTRTLFVPTGSVCYFSRCSDTQIWLTCGLLGHQARVDFVRGRSKRK